MTTPQLSIPNISEATLDTIEPKASAVVCQLLTRVHFGAVCSELKGHKLSVEMSRSSGKGEIKPGDWRCPSCGINNFARRTECFRCQQPAPSGGGGGGGGYRDDYRGGRDYDRRGRDRRDYSRSRSRSRGRDRDRRRDYDRSRSRSRDRRRSPERDRDRRRDYD